ncbi:MAG: 50S ribosomal protein L9 [Alphaproteobacteria bacterium]|nr:MAG: 50S ribosomal protein L9 [Alphaproteobacteria bacterium]
MQIILLERVENLGQMGDVVTVRSGYARNYLLPQNKALRATKDNVTYFEAQKKQLEANSLDRRKEAEKVAKKLDGLTVSVIRQASEGGQLYGSVTTRDISDAVTAAGITIDRKQVTLDRSFKMLGLYPVKVTLHPEVSVDITMNIARSEEEAAIQKERGKALISTDEMDEPSLAEAAILAVVEEETTEEAEAAEEAASEEEETAAAAEA